MNKLKVRFAPSPTGHLHIGGARTALFNYLLAKKNGGTFLLRIEDTDAARSTYESERVIINDLKWLGINWDEGIDKGGENGPYRSTERKDIYLPYVKQLLDSGNAYYCYCTSQELEEERKTLENSGQMPRYMGKCRNLTQEQVDKFKAEGRVPTIRFKVPNDEIIKVEDSVRGMVEFESNGIGDFIIVKSDGLPVYNFAVVIDDHLMGITLVIRGEEHLSNTPRQILIYDTLDFVKPKFAHVSIILGQDRSKMSKRHGATWIEQYRDNGYLPEAIINFLALLGWSPNSEKEIFNMDELISEFSLDRVSKNPAVFDLEKLNWVNAQYIKAAPLERITDLAIPHLKNAGFIKDENLDKDEYEWIKKIVATQKDGISYVKQIADRVNFFFEDDINPENDETLEILKGDHVRIVLDSLINKVKEAENIDEEFGKSVFKEIQKDTGIKGKGLFMTIRVAITGQMHGPEMYEVIPILGKEKVLQRVEKVINKYLD